MAYLQDRNHNKTSTSVCQTYERPYSSTYSVYKHIISPNEKSYLMLMKTTAIILL